MSSARLPPGCAPPSFHSGLLPRRRLPNNQTGLTSSGEAEPPLDLSWGRDCVKCLRPPQAAAPQPAAPEYNPEQRSEEHTSELQSLMRISYAVFCLTQKTKKLTPHNNTYSAKN